ncbi:hypothetical protein AXF42_Ash006088 [Apostasia shenzhenica]|uniref:Uncharacterized protein n=1 Tax=Apostasia shenzhenica TaxID=1088818 RepID=A0A2I0B062_9ASPA|nr:hypothetical protein AXF42_Ash006088 [Apostasia shenzhenica]
MHHLVFQTFNSSVGITEKVYFAELDDPFVKLRLQDWFWHQRTTVLARLANYMKNWIPKILEVEIEDEKQLDDSSENFLRYCIRYYLQIFYFSV